MEPYHLSDDVWLCENAVFLPKVGVLVISDLQLGKEQQLRAGADVLDEQAKVMLGLLEVLIDQTSAKVLVIAGDLKHEFGKTTFQERREVLNLVRKLQQRVMILAVRGNHDAMTAPLLAELGIVLQDSWSEGGFFVVHGHRLPEKDAPGYRDAKTIIIGHVHPAILVSDGVRSERFKCFLVDRFDHKRLVVLPSFSTLVEGTDILKGESFSPFLQGNSSQVYVLADELRPFGRVGDLRRVLG